jgi:hypothetical protein
MSANRNNNERKTATIMQPVIHDKCDYIWNCMFISPTQHGGHGVFAVIDIPIATMIPILGDPISRRDIKSHNSVYCWSHRSRAGHTLTINGSPNINPRHKVGSFGLAIAMMINEPLNKKPNCVIKLDHIVTSRRIKMGEELTVHYGDAYEDTRARMGYSLSSNRYLNNTNKQLDAYIYPSARTRNENIKHLQQHIQKCKRRKQRK